MVRNSNDLRCDLWSVFVLAGATLLGVWPALSNRQPFYYPDTTAYVRGADLGVSKFLGPRFATDWAKDERRQVQSNSEAAAQTSLPSAVKDTGHQRVILAGRSIIYGLLLYLGEVTGGMWLAVICQSLAISYLVYIFLIKLLRQSRIHYILVIAVLSVGSSFSFVNSMLMPDAFTAALFMGVVLLKLGWNELSAVELVLIIAVVIFSVLVHTSHALLLVILAGVVLLPVGNWQRDRPAQKRIVLIASGCLLLSAGWEAVFSAGVHRQYGAPPVRPPFLTAKVFEKAGVADLSDTCKAHSFVACRFQDKLPIDTDTFLWSEDQNRGVFSVADESTKRSLGDEQFRFAVQFVIRHPAVLGRTILLDTFRQLVTCGNPEYFYRSESLRFYAARLPLREFAVLRSSRAASSKVYGVFGRSWFYLGIVCLTVIAMVFVCLSKRRSGWEQRAASRGLLWAEATFLLLFGVLANAMVCGSLSAVNDRYQARVEWLLPLSAVTGLLLLLQQRTASAVCVKHEHGPICSNVPS